MSGNLASFQTATRNIQAPGLPGDFASMNPYATQLSSQVYNSTGFRAGPSGLVIGLFAWLDPSTWTFASNSGAGAPNGFVGRAGMLAMITLYLQGYGATIPAGFGTPNIYDAGDFWAVNNGTTEAVPNMKAYANNSNGLVTFANTGAPTTGGTSTASTISAQTNGATGTIVDNLFTAVSGLAGTLVPGTVLSGTGVAAGTTIVSQVTPLIAGETAGGLGRYLVTPRNQTVASTAITGTYGLLTVGGTVVAGYGLGQTLTSAVGGFAAGSTITGLGTGVGGAGTYYTQTQTVASGIINAITNIETGWWCRSFGAPGDVVKISSRSM
jgi:hypothetical protein